jgi:hypothetical protein
VIVGTYVDSGSVKHGFARFPDGTITSISRRGWSNISAQAINADGLVTGSFCCINGSPAGFVGPVNGKLKAIYPKGSIGIGSVGGINDKGVVTGSFLGSDEITPHGFLRKP